MNGFGFIEYDDPLDARDVVPGKHHPSFQTNRRSQSPYVRLPLLRLSQKLTSCAPFFSFSYVTRFAALYCWLPRMPSRKY